MALSDRRNIWKVKVITFRGYRGRVSRSLSCSGVLVLSGKQCLEFQIRINGWGAVFLKGREEAMLSSLCVLNYLYIMFWFWWSSVYLLWLTKFIRGGLKSYLRWAEEFICGGLKDICGGQLRLSAGG